jgi:hypothetical protein
MTRNLILIATACFRGYGCSGCGWVFTPSGPLVGNTLEEMKRLYQNECDKEFREHACADHPRATGSGGSGRAAVEESVPQRSGRKAATESVSSCIRPRAEKR